MLSDVGQTNTNTNQQDVTQEECEEYCRNVVEATGCEYRTNTRECDAFTYALHKEIVKGTIRCHVFENRNNEARQRAGLPLTPGRLSEPYNTKTHNCYHHFRRGLAKSK